MFTLSLRDFVHDLAFILVPTTRPLSPSSFTPAGRFLELPVLGSCSLDPVAFASSPSQPSPPSIMGSFLSLAFDIILPLILFPAFSRLPDVMDPPRCHPRPGPLQAFRDLPRVQGQAQGLAEGQQDLRIKAPMTRRP